MRDVSSMRGGLTCWTFAAIFAAGFLVLALRLRDVQIVSASNHGFQLDRQSVRRVQTEGMRGRILDTRGRVLADNKPSFAIAVNAVSQKVSTWDATVASIRKAVDSASSVVGRASHLTDDDIRRHVRRSLARPLVAWRDVTPEEAARYFEHEDSLPGFVCLRTFQRFYPMRSLAAQTIGYVGRDRAETDEGDSGFDFRELEMRGRSGLEYYYDGFVRGVPGEKGVLVDARGFAVKEWTVVEPEKGPDLVLGMDARIQAEAERQLAGCAGACVVLDARTGEVLAMASAPGFDLNDFIPSLGREAYNALCEDPGKPLLNRACGGSYAPGSTFKPVTALAALSTGLDPAKTRECTGVFSTGGMRIRCSRSWGHGDVNLASALRDSCNPYFCEIAAEAGSNAVMSAARALGLGSRTGIDFPVDAPGVVPDDVWKRERYSDAWFSGDLAQMAIGQGMLLASPLQMARVAGAIGTGTLVTPVFRKGARGPSSPIPFPREHLDAVRLGMRKVVVSGTGKSAAENVDAYVIGKTGTAEIGSGANRRKNAWFIAYAESNDGKKSVAAALIVENGESGGATAAPKVRGILETIFGRKEPSNEA
jgi:penicillin-binding protein 2